MRLLLWFVIWEMGYSDICDFICDADLSGLQFRAFVIKKIRLWSIRIRDWWLGIIF